MSIRISHALSRATLVAIIFVAIPERNVSGADEVRTATTTPSREAALPPQAPAELLKRLKTRDAAFENRILKIEERWIEHIDPRAMQAEAQFADLKFGGIKREYPDPKTLPDAYDQPHRRLVELLVREPDVALKIVGELEKRLNPKYGTIPNVGFISRSIDGWAEAYSPETKTLHQLGSGGTLRSRQHAFEWCMGYGFGKRMTSIEKIETKDDGRIVARGPGTAFSISDCTFEIEVDRDLIVRRAVVSTPARTGGANEYRISTKGIARAKDAPAVAKEGISQRVLQPVGKPERLYTKYDIAFVSITEPLSDEEYADAIAITPAPGTSTVDMRPRRQRKAE